MLVLNRKCGERIFVGKNIEIVINRIDKKSVSIAINAPSNIRIIRGELDDQPGNIYRECSRPFKGKKRYINKTKIYG